MRVTFSRIILAAGILLLASQAAWAADEQMLPPTDPNSSPPNQPCAVTGTNGVLVMHNDGVGGTSAINCNTKVTADPSGNVTAAGSVTAAGAVNAGTVVISGEALGALTGADSDTLTQLNSAGTCAANYALTKTSSGFACVAVTDISGVGTVALPACSSGQYLFWDGSTFSCPALPAAGGPTPPTCNGAGQALQFDGTNYSCVTIGLGASCGGVFPSTAHTAPIIADRYIAGDAYSSSSTCAGGSNTRTDYYQCENGTWVYITSNCS